MKTYLCILGVLLFSGSKALAQTGPQAVIRSGDVWQYLVTSSDPAANWKTTLAPTYNDTNAPWFGGKSPLGYGGQGLDRGNGLGILTINEEGGTCIDRCVSSPAVASNCRTCPSGTPQAITTYFRKTVTLTSVAGSTFSMQYQRDDGIIIYINGTEVARENLPASPTYSTLATAFPSDADEVAWVTVDPSKFAPYLKQGVNLIAVEIHQVSATSSDIRFNMDLKQMPPQIPAAPAQPDPISVGEVWKYLVTDRGPDFNWKAALNSTPIFNDASWFSGPSPLGYGAQGGTQGGCPGATAATTISQEGGTCLDECFSGSAVASSCKSCTGTNSRQVTTYFRKTFSLTNVAGSSFPLEYQRDDGIVIYINGQEVVREGFDRLTTPISHTTTASAIPVDCQEKEWKLVNVPPCLMRVGTNLIAVEIHQASFNSSDIRFNLKLHQTPAPPAPAVTLQRGPYLQRYSDDPTLVIPPDKQSMTIRWSTNVDAPGRVVYTTNTGAPLPPTPYQAPKGMALYKTPSATNPQVCLYNYSVTLNNLAPDTKYTYTLESDGGSKLHGDATNYFVTAPLIGSTKKTRMWVLGDFGKADQPSTAQNKVRDEFSNYVQNKAVYSQDEIAKGTDKYIDLWLWLGDNAYGWGLTEQYQKSVFDVYDGRKAPDDPAQRFMRQTPIFALPGNHDYRGDNPYSRYDHGINHYYDVVNHMTAGVTAGEHSKKEEYYSFDHGNIHFVSLDTYGFQSYTTTTGQVQETAVFPKDGDKDGVQIAWLKRDLASAQDNSNIKWIVVFLHHPPYSMGSHNSDTDLELVNIRDKLVKGVLDTYRVDLVLAGHSHTYERSRPMNGHYDKAYSFSATVHNAPDGNNGQSSGLYDGSSGETPAAGQVKSVGSCFYYKSAADPKNHIVYVVNGSGGGIEGIQPPCPNPPSSSTDAPCWPHKAMQTAHNLSGSMYIEVEGDRLDAKFITESGSVADQFTIIKDTKAFTIPPTDNSTRKAACECTGPDGWTHYTDLKANLLLSIKKNGNAIGKAWDGTFDLTLQGQPGATLLSYNAQPNDYLKATTNVQNRYWTLKPTQEIAASKPVSIRHYWKRIVDFSGFQNAYYGPYGAMYDYSYQTIVINDDCNLPPAGYERNPAKSTTNGSSAYGHYAIPKAPNYTANGAWVYLNGSAASSSTFKYGVMPGTDPAGYMYIADYSEFVVGRLKCIGGTIAGLFGPYDRTGNARVAALQADIANVLVYPNPTLDGRVYFNPVLQYQSYQLTDMQGKVLKQDTTAGSMDAFDLSAYPPGVYSLVSEGADKTERFKIIKSQ